MMRSMSLESSASSYSTAANTLDFMGRYLIMCWVPAEAVRSAGLEPGQRGPRADWREGVRALRVRRVMLDADVLSEIELLDDLEEDAHRDLVFQGESGRIEDGRLRLVGAILFRILDDVDDLR